MVSGERVSRDVHPFSFFCFLLWPVVWVIRRPMGQRLIMARTFSKAFYNSKEWKDTRDYVLKRDRYLCVKCGAPAEEVHHIIHLSPANIGDVKVTMNPENLISLCKACHFEEHRGEHGDGRKRKEREDGCEYEFDPNGFLVRKAK